MASKITQSFVVVFLLVVSVLLYGKAYKSQDNYVLANPKQYTVNPCINSIYSFSYFYNQPRLFYPLRKTLLSCKEVSILNNNEKQYLGGLQ